MKSWFAELIGTFFLVFAGTGAITINEVQNGSVTHVGIALTFGLVVLSLIYAFGDVSGAHFNPAVTFGFLVARRFPIRNALAYWICQFVGAALASLTLKLLFPESEFLGGTEPVGTSLRSFVLEGILTTFLMLVILSVSTGSKEKGAMAGIAIGSVIALEALFAGPICGASMNPARSFGPAILTGHLTSLWIYFSAPLAGALLANILWRCTHDDLHPSIGGDS